MDELRQRIVAECECLDQRVLYAVKWLYQHDCSCVAKNGSNFRVTDN